MRLLLVEDDEIFAQSLKERMTQHYVVDYAQDGEEGWDYTQVCTYDIIILDVSLPKLNGIELCKRLRQQDYSGPILLLTAKGTSESKVEGLDAGADDYVVKPCTVEELFARIRALLRRQGDSGSPLLIWGQLCLNPSSCEVSYNQVPLSLSPKEYRLLELLLRHPQRVFSRDAILEHLWSFEDPPGEETVRAHIKGLRRKLKQGGAKDVIQTVYGLGYRLKALDEKVPPPSPAPISDPPSSSDPPSPAPTSDPPSSSDPPPSPSPMEDALRESWEKFKQPILARLQTLEDVLTALKKGTLSEELREQGERQAHKLTGSLGMFGRQEGSNLARRLEEWLETIALKTLSPPIKEIQQFQSLVESLRHELQPGVDQEPESKRSQPDETPAIAPVPSTMPKPLLLLVDDDHELVQQLQQEALNWGIEIESAPTIAEAKTAIARRIPDAVLLDLSFPESPREGLALLESLTTQFKDLPVLVFTVKDGFSDRIAVAQRGGRAFLSKPISPNLVFEFVQDTLQKKRRQTPRVLTVDDDPIILDKLQYMLKTWGIEMIPLADPRQFWPTLETTHPDLLILDVDMPHVNGIEICQVVRNDPTHNSLPILFLSAHQDLNIIHKIYQAGADDYISKPIAEPEFVTRIFNRLERHRLLKNLYETDRLTGVANHRCSTKILHQYLHRSQRYKQSFCLALLELEGFKGLNHQYGHLFGDQVLRKFGYLLRQFFRGEDIVSRWGGVEFVIGMYGMTRQDGVKRLQSLLEQVKIEIVTPDPSHNITFSAGIVDGGKGKETLGQLYQKAEAALRKGQELKKGDRLFCDP